MKQILDDTIVGISTGASSGAIAIVRMSGAGALQIADQLFCDAKQNRPSSFVPRMLTLGKVSTPSFDEQAMCVVFRAPKSYTGEDLVEFQCHGGTKIASGIMKTCISQGARPAANGEFTKRAFLNGKMTLSSAEGMMDMINAESDAEIRAGYELLSGALSKFAAKAQESLTDILAEVEVSFDYPEETIEYITKTGVKSGLTNILNKANQILSTSETGRLIKDGINVLIVGKPNVGKSSLLNALLGTDKAIVTDVAGTTRDTVDGTFLLGDVKVNLTDTAGIRDTDDKVEKIGVDKAKSLISTADIVLFLLDTSRPFGEDDQKILDTIKSTNYLVVKTKTDLKEVLDKNFDREISVSAMTGSGIDELKNKILEMVKVSDLSSSKLIITNERHKDALKRTARALENAINGINSSTLDLVAIDIKEAYECIGEITGTTTSEEIIDKIFSKFCLGK